MIVKLLKSKKYYIIILLEIQLIISKMCVKEEIINYFIKYKEKKYSLEGKTFMLDFIDYNTSIINWEKNVKCEECGNCDS